MSHEPKLINLRQVKDKRGDLSFSELSKDFPFEVKRVYWISNAPENQERGGHAHKTDIQVIVCAQGKVKVKLLSLDKREMHFVLDTTTGALLIPPMWWGEVLFQDNAVLIGFSSELFNEVDYIRNKSNFL